MARYEKYKDSGQFWLGEVPAHWNFLKMKYVFSEKSQKGFPNEPLLSATQNHGVIPQSLYENRVVTATKGLESLKLVEVGDFVISLRSFQGGIEYAYYRGIISPAYTILRPKNIDASYFKYLGKSGIFIDLIKSTVTGIREGQNVDYGKLREFYLPIPPIEEQKAISSYLDKVTCDIDNAIEQQKNMLALLSERKTILIRNHVINGISDQHNLKDTGVYYVPQIPSYWDIKKGKWLFKEEKREVKKDDEIVTCFRDGQVTLRKNRRTEGFTNAIQENGYQGIREGDLVIHNMDAFAGAIGVSDSDGKATPVYSVCTPILDGIEPKYYALLLRSYAYSGFILSLAKGIRERSSDFRFDDFRNLLLPVPPYDEQCQIVAAIENAFSEIDKSVNKHNRMIEALKERKRIIINDVVTGKIKVL